MSKPNAIRNIRCPKGHYYDANKYASCPHCAGERGEKPKENVTTSWVEEKNDVAVMPGQGIPGYDNEPETRPLREPEEDIKEPADKDDAKTISIFTNHEGEENIQPTVGWLICVKGRMKGKDFSLKTGCNFIGRDWDMDICLADEKSVSRKRHAAIIYEPRQNVFIVKPGDSRELFYLKDEVVLEPRRMEKNDIIQVGNVSLMLIPCCDDKFTWTVQDNEE